jgi:protease YdgD
MLWIAACIAAVPAIAQDVTQQMISDEAAPLWRAVGALNIVGGHSCTATLISETEAITAAHCLFYAATLRRVEPSNIRFVLGLRRDEYSALREVTATAILPGYSYSGGESDMQAIEQDIALLRLDRAVTPQEAVPFGVADWPTTAVNVDIVGYGRDRRMMASIRADCPVAARARGAAVLDCAAVPGLSGAPVTLSAAAGPQVLVAVVSAVVGTVVKSDQMMVVDIAPHLAELRTILGP